MKIRPLYDRVIVKRVSEEEKSKGGIIIPDSAKEKPFEGKIIAVGNGKLLDDGSTRALTVKPGEAGRRGAPHRSRGRDPRRARELKPSPRGASASHPSSSARYERSAVARRREPDAA
jgi:Chaperonin 10 Kd subunit